MAAHGIQSGRGLMILSALGFFGVTKLNIGLTLITPVPV
jgi:hypothetical protein